MTDVNYTIISNDQHTNIYTEFESPYSPPKWTLKIIWPILYIILFISFVFCLHDETCSKPPGLLTFFFQLAFNIVWYPIMFTACEPELALIDLFLLLASLTAMIIVWPPPLNYINIPYLLWCGFAFYLNLTIVLKRRVK